jgi:hypothetical protein
MHRSKQRALLDQLVGAIKQLSWDSEAARYVAKGYVRDVCTPLSYLEIANPSQ